MKNRRISAMDAACSAERRGFLRILAATTAGLAVGGCYGGPESKGLPQAGSQPPPGNLAPAWQTVPTITFTQGIASNISIAGYVTVPDGDALTISINSAVLPAGVTYNAANKRFVYDGVGTVGSIGGVV